jgi:aspartate carbamoyltransferase catalytic subunit
MAFPHRHLLGIEGLAAADLVAVLDLAESFREISERAIKKVPTLRGRTVVHYFVEPSTRTLASFQIAAQRLSADSVTLAAASSSAQKGETLLDTARNLQAMHPDILVIRHLAAGAPHFLAKHLRCAVINAGDGAHEHPTQALLDCSTMRAHKGRIAGLLVTIVGDIAHSRVARSNIHALTRLGAAVRVCGPATMLPAGIEELGVQVHLRLEPALEGADVVMVLRIQQERLGDRSLFPDLREYARLWGLDARRLERAQPDAIVMHPGPINRGVEIDPDLADGPRSVILDQVTRGVAVRMALLYLLAGSPGEEA